MDLTVIPYLLMPYTQGGAYEENDWNVLSTRYKDADHINFSTWSSAWRHEDVRGDEEEGQIHLVSCGRRSRL